MWQQWGSYVSMYQIGGGVKPRFSIKLRRFHWEITVFRSQPPESDTRLPADISTTMQFSAIITFSMVLFSFASLTEAGVNQFGACYCSPSDCTEVNRGIYRTRCDPGCKYLDIFWPAFQICFLEPSHRHLIWYKVSKYWLSNWIFT